MTEKVSNRNLVDYLTRCRAYNPEEYSKIVFQWTIKEGFKKVAKAHPKFYAKVRELGSNNTWLIRESILLMQYNDCPVCGKPMALVHYKGCTSRCATLNPAVKTQSQETYLARTGYRFTSSNPEVQDKRKANYKKKTGYDHWSSDPAIQEKKEQTNLKNRGVRFPTQDRVVMAKGLFNKFMSVRQRYGVDNVSQLDSVKETIRNTHIARRGVPHPMMDPKVKAKQIETIDKNNKAEPGRRARIQAKTERTNLEKWGYTHPMKNPEHFESRMTRTKLWKSKDGSRYQVQGYEPIVLSELEASGAIVKPGRKGLPVIEYIDTEGKTRSYYVDGKVISPNGDKYVLEVKCPYTLCHWLEDNISKFIAAQRVLRKQGVNFMLAISNEYGEVDYLKNPTRSSVLQYIDDSGF